LNIEIDSSGFWEASWIESVSRIALQSTVPDYEVDLSVRLTTNDEIRRLNLAYRGIDEATDVLSFGLDSQEPADFVLPPSSTANLGEIVIAFPYVVSQAGEAEQSVEAELAHVLVHGILHVLGFDHEEPHDEAVMRAKEDGILHQLGFAHHHD
jgi:probable rRNA maturation factor